MKYNYVKSKRKNISVMSNTLGVTDSSELLPASNSYIYFQFSQANWTRVALVQ